MSLVILIADDEAGGREPLGALLKENHEVILCKDGEEALQVLEKRQVDLVITDNIMPKTQGLELIKQGKAKYPGTSFVLMTAHGTIDQAVQAIQLGADDYLTKPFEFDEVLLRVQRIEEIRTYRSEKMLRASSTTGHARLIGSSACIQQARQFVQDVATAPSSVLLLGPSGSGKEVLARAIHESGPRSGGPFVPVNCASLNEQLLESELFGHEKGAFTGAVSAKAGKFELAKGGTIFLDEAGELSPAVQAKLLRVLQDREFFRVGGTKIQKSDARVIAATNRPLKEMTTQGTFREDLYFRLNVLTFWLKPLNERKEDISSLITFFWNRLQREFGKPAKLSPATLERLQNYDYPGNVRELQNILERLMVLGGGKGEIDPHHLPQEFHSQIKTQTNTGTNGPSVGDRGLTEVLDEVEKGFVEQAMESSGGNQVKAAEILKITRGALQYKLKKYGLLKAA